MNIEISCDYFTVGKTTSGNILINADNARISQTVDAKFLLSQMDIKEIIEYVEGLELMVINKPAEAA